MFTRSITPLLLLISIASLAQAQPIKPSGTYSGDDLTMNIAPTSDGGYNGTISLSGKTFPFNATLTDNTLIGKFSSGASAYPFTAKVTADSIIFNTGKTKYNLQRQGPANPEPVQQPRNPAPGDVTPPPAAEPTPHAQIEAALKRAKAYLYAQERNGSWDLPAPGPLPVPNARGEVSVIDIQNSTQWGGLSALATYALLAAGESDQEPRIQEAVKYLEKANIKGTYALAMRAQVWNSMPNAKRKQFLELAKKDRDLLLTNAHKTDPEKGFFHYLSNDPASDHSASQFGVLGLWACNQLGAEVPTVFWKEVEKSWIKDQDASGGWNYANFVAPRPPVSPSMTAAGVATLFITLDMIHGDEGVDCRGNIPHKEIDAGIKWINSHYDQVGSGNWPFYTLYGIERIGLASGYKYLGSVDWYKQGARKLVASQMPDGSWGTGTADTCFAVLFLVRGRNPVVMSKLQYDIDMHGDKTKEGNWNQRPRDAANFTKWLARQLERELNWQIVNLENPVEDLHDAPILYIAGNQPLAFTAGQEEKLRLFVEQGGLIVGNADCSQPGFSVAFKKLGTKLFPPYEFRELPSSHLIFNSMFDRKKWRAGVNVQGLSNGARELMLLIPTGDPARFWQTGAFSGRESAYELMANIFMYVTEKQDLRFKGDSWIVTPNSANPPANKLKLARLEYTGNWNPEPGGWKRLAAVLQNDALIGLDVQPVKLGEGALAKDGYKIAHITGSGKFKLTDPQRAELKTFIESGGTLIADALGGNGDAASSLESEIAAIAPAKMQILKPDNPIYAQLGMPANDITFRPYAMKQEVGHAKGPRLRAAMVNNRPAVIYSQEDLSVGMVGQPIDGIIGYTPQSATAIMKSLILYLAKNQ